METPERYGRVAAGAAPPASDPEEGRRSLRRCDLVIMALLALAGIAGFLMRGGGAYVWPTADNFPLFQAAADPEAAWVAEDAFTQALLDPNPRHVFTSAVATLGRVFGVDYYQVFVALGLLFAVVSPQLAYLMLSRCPLLGQTVAARGLVPRLVIACGVALWATIYDHRIAFASWPPLYTEATAHGLSLGLGLGGLALLWGGWRQQVPARAVAWGLMILATVFHPANGFAMWCFHAVCTLRLERWWFLSAGLHLLAWVLIPALTLSILFSASIGDPVNVDRLVEAYVKADQPHHYYLPFLIGQLKTYANLSLLAACLVVGWTAGLFIDRELRLRLLGVLALPVVALLAQHAFAFWIPSVTIILAGPARLLMVVPWLAAVILALGMARWTWLLAVERNWSSGWQRSSLGGGVMIAASVAMAWVVGLDLHAPAAHQAKPAWLAVARSVASVSDPDELIFCVDRGLAVDVRHFGHRAVYFSSNFPFNAGHLDEFGRRSEIYHGFINDPLGSLPVLREEGVDVVVVERSQSLPLPVLITTRRFKVYGLRETVDAAVGDSGLSRRSLAGQPLGATR